MMTDKTTVDIAIRFNEEEVHVTPNVVLQASFAETIKKLLADQADRMINTLEKSKNL